MNERIAVLDPFWEYRELKKWTWDNDIVKNILLFLPFGFSAYLLFGWKSILNGFCLSFGIEVTQYVLCIGWLETADLFNNTIGTIFGCFIGYLISSVVNYDA